MGQIFERWTIGHFCSFLDAKSVANVDICCWSKTCSHVVDIYFTFLKIYTFVYLSIILNTPCPFIQEKWAKLTIFAFFSYLTIEAAML